MEQLSEKLNTFEFTHENKTELLKKHNFNLKSNVISGITFDKDFGLKKAINGNNDILKPGLYFWVFLISGQEYKLYVGMAGTRKTTEVNKNGIEGRLHEYLSAFQPSSPNDYKIHFFNEYFSEFQPKPTYRIYFSLYEDHYPEQEFERLKLIQWEDEVRYTIKPIFDNKNFFNDDNKKEIEKGYQKAYADFFDRKISLKKNH
jgi:hypothetical protein